MSIFWKCQIFLLVFLTVSFSFVFGQGRLIKGVITNIASEFVPRANIILRNDNGDIIAFTNSGNNGEYHVMLPVRSSNKSLYVEVNSLGYRKDQQLIKEDLNKYDFVLVEQAIDLKEIKVTQQPVIITIGDTISYNVSSFSRPEDRSIGDVIKRLPGVSVSESGQISYNGKAIQNLYIQGDDLMDGRYGLATRVITKDMIKSVDVIEHFQPIKVLKNKVFTDDVAMNLILKDEHSIKVAGQIVLGIGLPEQYDVALNTMLFNTRIKFLNSLKANNSGYDLRNDFSQLGISCFVSEVQNTKTTNLLSLGTAGNPDLPKANYYLNNSKLFNANNLVNKKNGLQIKSNLQVFFDRNKLRYSNKLDNYLNSDTVRYRESQLIDNAPSFINTSLTATANKSAYFFNNKLSLNLERNVANGYLTFNETTTNQDLNENGYNVFNDLSYTPALKNSKNVIDLRWYIGYINNPKKLAVIGGLNLELLNEGTSYQGFQQSLETPTFYNDITVAYRIFNSKLIQHSYQVGVINERQRLNSTLDITQVDMSNVNFKGDVGNRLLWTRDRVFANSEYSIKNDRWRANLSVPLIAQRINYQQDEFQLNSSKKQLLINPSANVTLQVNSEDYITLAYRFNNDIGKITDVYRGVIVSNYRTVSANNTDLREQQISNLNLAYNFKRTIIMLFASAKIGYKNILANSILSSELSENLQRTVLLPLENQQNNVDVTADISKYIFVLNTTVSSNLLASKSQYNQLINGQLYPFTNQSYSLQGKIESKLFGAITLSYYLRSIWNRSMQKHGMDNFNGKGKRIDQNINLGFSPLGNLNFNLLVRQIYSVQANVSSVNYFFADVKARYYLKKWRTDFELDISNLADIKKYEILSLSSNQSFISSYEIRGRMSIIRATFNL